MSGAKLPRIARETGQEISITAGLVSDVGIGCGIAAADAPPLPPVPVVAVAIPVAVCS
jgi:hypothetical protein